MGQCYDGSVVLLHSTPDAGVQISGTTTPEGGYNSRAITLAQSYMQRYKGFQKYDYHTSVGNYIKQYNYFRWNENTLRIRTDTAIRVRIRFLQTCSPKPQGNLLQYMTGSFLQNMKRVNAVRHLPFYNGKISKSISHRFIKCYKVLNFLMKKGCKQ